MCLLFLQMARELEEILREHSAQPANSCVSQNGVSFLDQVISPLYEVMAAVSLFAMISVSCNLCSVNCLLNLFPLYLKATVSSLMNLRAHSY